MKHQALFSSRDKSTKIKVWSAAILFRAIRVNDEENPMRPPSGQIVTHSPGQRPNSY